MTDTTQPTMESTAIKLREQLRDLGIRVADTTPAKGGALFHDLRLLYPVGKGGMGVVLRGRDDALDIDVAVKVISAHYADDQKFIERLISEARAIARLDHPNIVRVLRVGEFLQQHYLVMEFINGNDVNQMIQKSGPLPALEAAKICAAAASALIYAHRKSIVHRDIKPHNILVSQDREKIKLVDFGIAHDHTLGKKTPSDMPAMGTPIYMSPEQLHGGEADEFSDIYSLGITLYNMLAGDVQEELQMRVFDADRRAGHALSVEATQGAEHARFFNDLIESMCEPRPTDRPLLIDVLSQLDVFIQSQSGGDSERRTRMAKRQAAEKTSTGRVRGNLREPLSAFVGRQSELRDMAALFGLVDAAGNQRDTKKVDAARLVTVLGSGGTGKTRFAQRFAALYQEHYPGGIWFVDMVNCRRREDIVHAVAGVLGVDLKSVEHAVELVGNALLGQCDTADGPLLLILDNFEQCIDHAEATIGEWMRMGVDLRFMVTSRILMGIEGEREFPLGPLGLPPADAELPFADEGTKTLARQYEHFDAVRLFVSRARAASPEVSIERDHFPAVVEICRRLDGNALALELAASRIKVLPPRKLLERLDNRFELLRSDCRNAGKRQSTLRSTIDWSWDLLEIWECSALAQLSICSAGFTLEAAEAIIDLGEFEDAPPVMDVVQSLRDKSLIYRRDPQAAHLDLRFGLYESIREYANERKAELLDDDELMGLNLRFGDYYVQAARKLDKALYSKEGPKALDQLQVELQNLLNIQALLLEMQAPYLAAQAICSASFVMHVRGPHAKRVRRLLLSLDALNAKAPDIGKHEVPSAEALYEAFFPQPEWNDTELDALRVVALTVELLNNLTTAYLDDGDTLNAERASERAVNLARGLLSALEDPNHEELWKRALKQLSNSLDRLAAVEERRANYTHALTLLDEAEEIESELEDENGLAAIISNRGNILIRSGQADEAMAAYQRAEDICRRTGNLIGLVIHVSNRGWVALSTGLYDEALRYFKEGEELSRMLRFNNGLGWNIGRRGNIHQKRGEYQEALHCFAEAESIFREMGNLVSMANNIGNRGSVYSELGRHEDALDCFSEAEGIARRAGDKENLTFWVGSRAAVLAKLGHQTAALKAYAEAEARSDAINSRHRLAHFLVGRASVYLKLERVEEALLLLEESIELSEKTGSTMNDNYLEAISLVAGAHFELSKSDVVEDPDATRQLSRSLMNHRKSAEHFLVEGMALAKNLHADSRPKSSVLFGAYERLRMLSEKMKHAPGS